jgi:hypothetical protein
VSLGAQSNRPDFYPTHAGLLWHLTLTPKFQKFQLIMKSLALGGFLGVLGRLFFLWCQSCFFLGFLVTFLFFTHVVNSLVDDLGSLQV